MGIATILLAVVVGGLNEARYGASTAETIGREKLGTLNVLFVGPWTGEKIRAIGEICRRRGMTMLMDEAQDRRTGRLPEGYARIWPEVKSAMDDFKDVIRGSNVMSEYGGLSFNWPRSSVANAPTEPRPAKTFDEAESNCLAVLRTAIAEADRLGLPRPFFSIEPTMAAPWILRGGMDDIHLEVTYGPDLERRYATTLGAVAAFGRAGFGADMAMIWYGGNQRDGLWNGRWRTSLYHAWLRGADPIYAEHGVMDYHALGLKLGTEHPDVKRFRRTLAEFAAWEREHPRAKGLPRAAVAAIYGRYDGFVGGWQTHLWGQRLNDAWRIGAHERAWEIFNGLYRRTCWEDRNQWGDADFTGNPPFGQAHVLPYDASDACFGGYKTLFFLGRNVMDEALYAKLVRFVTEGGTLLLAACHLDTADTPGEAFVPFRGGDWRELTGLRMKPGQRTRLPYGIKFRSTPPGWKMNTWGPFCDPWFTDGGFDMPEVEVAGAEALAVTSDRFEDPKDFDPAAKGVVWFNRLGKGKVVLLASLEPVGDERIRPLYTYLLERAVAATDVWPKADCSDRVRWAVYPDGTVYFLNTENRRSEEVVFHRSVTAASERLTLAPGEIKELPGESGEGRPQTIQRTDTVAVVLR